MFPACVQEQDKSDLPVPPVTFVVGSFYDRARPAADPTEAFPDQLCRNLHEKLH